MTCDTKSGILEYASLVAVQPPTAKFRVHDQGQRVLSYSGPIGNVKIGEKVVVWIKFSANEDSVSYVDKIFSKSDLVTGDGSIDYVDNNFGYISGSSCSERVFFFKRNFRPVDTDYCYSPLYHALDQGSPVKFTAVRQNVKGVTFIPREQESHNNCNWLGQQVQFIPARLKHRDLESRLGKVEVQDCVGIVICVHKQTGIIWNEHIGRVLFTKNHFETSVLRRLKPLTVVTFDARPLPIQQHWDIAFQAVLISAGPKTVPPMNYESCIAVLRQVHSNGTDALLYNENFGTIFVRSLDYYTDEYMGKSFEQELVHHKHFDVLVVANDRHYSTGDWRAIFVRPIRMDQASAQKTTFEHSSTKSKTQKEKFVKKESAVFSDDLMEELESELSALDYEPKNTVAKPQREILSPNVDFESLSPGADQVKISTKRTPSPVAATRSADHSQSPVTLLPPPGFGYVPPIFPTTSTSSPFGKFFTDPFGHWTNAQPFGVGQNSNSPLLLRTSSSTSAAAVFDNERPDWEGEETLETPMAQSQGFSLDRDVSSQLLSALTQIALSHKTLKDAQNQTEKESSERLFKAVMQNRSLFQIVKTRHRHLIQPIFEIVSNKDRLDVDLCHVAVVTQTPHSKTVETQTVRSYEKTIMDELTRDKEIFDFLMDSDSDLLLELTAK